MEQHFSTLVDYEFTAELEDLLDSISRDEVDREEYLKKFISETSSLAVLRIRTAVETD